jgi:hypothetical protein
LKIKLSPFYSSFNATAIILNIIPIHVKVNCARVHQVHLQPVHHDSEIAASSLFITIKQFTQQRSKAIAG